ncbi:Unconventional myosin-Vb [Trichinella sp. T8]|nr:Unconventional myosin-Vb [Trichinella sp. T8]
MEQDLRGMFVSLEVEWKYESFFDRYFLLLTMKERNEQSTTLSDKCRQICERFLNNGNFEFGSTKIFFRTGQIALLEAERHMKLNKSVLLIQKCVRKITAGLQLSYYAFGFFDLAVVVWRARPSGGFFIVFLDLRLAQWRKQPLSGVQTVIRSRHRGLFDPGRGRQTSR